MHAMKTLPIINQDCTVTLQLKDAKRNIKISNFARTYTQSFIEVRH